jgi:uncharacterized membrane protein YhiD involved in acid resistance
MACSFLRLSALIGLEREVRQKHAGLRTHTLVGVDAALFMLISKYGFTDCSSPGWWYWTPRGSRPRSVTRRLPRSANAISALRVR